MSVAADVINEVPVVLNNFVNGQYVEAENKRDVIDPVTGEVQALSPETGPQELDAAFEAAQKAFETWSRTTPADRQLALFRLSNALEERVDELVDLECFDTGKPRGLTLEAEAPMMLDHLRFFAGAARSIEGKSATEYIEDHISMIRREPIGVCAQVIPWNYPMVTAIWKLGPALAAGNTVVMKPSETTPMTTLKIAEIAAEFLPEGVLNVVCGGRDTGRAMIQHPVPGLVSFTGSVVGGREVAHSAAHGLKRVHLELGGKAPVIVFDDADIESAAAGISEAGYFNGGQDCTAATRVLVQKGVHDAFVEALGKQAKAAKTGPPQEDVLYGPLNNADQLARVRGFLDRLPDHAEIVSGGRAHQGTGYFQEATVVAGLEQTDEAVQTEIFGPVITVQPFTDEAEAVKLANDVRYGLSSSVWTTNHGRAMRMAGALDFGCVWINTHLIVVPEMPHGGFKESGYGKDLSMYGVEDYTRIKHLMSHIGE